MKLSIVIPAQEKNKYHNLGDLVPFGDTTLLEWKITQCKELVSSSQIYINSDSQLIEDIALKEEVNFIKRENSSYNEVISNTLDKLKEDIIVWTNPTSPFISNKDYVNMIEKIKNDKDIESITSVYSKYDYVYFDNKRLNFSNNFTPRSELIPVKIVTNGCYIIRRHLALKNNTLYSENPYLYEVDYLSSVEIKDLNTYQLSKELISAYFKRELNV